MASSGGECNTLSYETNQTDVGDSRSLLGGAELWVLGFDFLGVGGKQANDGLQFLAELVPVP